MAMRDLARAYRRPSLEERGKPPMATIDPPVGALGPEEAMALARKMSFIVMIVDCSDLAKKRANANYHAVK